MIVFWGGSHWSAPRGPNERAVRRVAGPGALRTPRPQGRTPRAAATATTGAGARRPASRGGRGRGTATSVAGTTACGQWAKEPELRRARGERRRRQHRMQQHSRGSVGKRQRTGRWVSVRSDGARARSEVRGCRRPRRHASGQGAAWSRRREGAAGASPRGGGVGAMGREEGSGDDGAGGEAGRR